MSRLAKLGLMLLIVTASNPASGQTTSGANTAQATTGTNTTQTTSDTNTPQIGTEFSTVQVLRIKSIEQPAAVVRGSSLKLTLNGLDPAKNGVGSALHVKFDEVHRQASTFPTGVGNSNRGKPLDVLGTIGGEGNTTCTVVVPPTLRLGNYSVGVTLKSDEEPAELAYVQVVRPPSAPLVVTAVAPVIAFPNTQKTFDLTVLGNGFSEVPEDNVLVFDGQDEIEVNWADTDPKTITDPKSEKPAGEFTSSHKLTFKSIPMKYWGTQKIRIRVGNELSAPTLGVNLSGYAKSTPIVVGVIVTALLGWLIYGVITQGLKPATIAGERCNILTTLLLDPQTDIYSLEKFQFYCWTGASVFGYIYLLVTRSLIQGRFEFADIPENLPGLILVSGTTSAISTAITAARGSKGAGDIRPSLSDFVTVGGVVSSERFQFFVWTILGALAFLFLIVVQSPGQFQDLPKIPEGFLYLMGVSSAGYLGGKLARKQGPVIDSIDATLGSLIFAIYGHGLSRTASFEIDGKPLSVKSLSTETMLTENTRGPAPDATLEVLQKDDTSSDPTNLATQLRLTMTDHVAWLTAKGLDKNYFGPLPTAAAITLAETTGQAAEKAKRDHKAAVDKANTLNSAAKTAEEDAVRARDQATAAGGDQAAALKTAAETADAKAVAAKKAAADANAESATAEQAAMAADSAARAATAKLAPEAQPPGSLSMKRKLTIINPDGQKATWEFQVRRR